MVLMLKVTSDGTGLKVIKLFFMLKSTVRALILLINVKMPTIISILTFISRINTTYMKI